MRLAAYVRVSVDNKNDSLDAQEDAIRLWAAANEHEVVALFTDTGSGTLGEEDRAGLSEALAAVRAGDAEGIVAHRTDRFARALHVSEAIYATCWRSGGRVFETFGGEILEDDPLDPARALIRRVLACVAQYERDAIAMRMQGGRRRAAEQGRFLGGSRPIGWSVSDDGTLIADDAEQAMIARVRELRGRGWSLRRIGAEVGIPGAESVSRLCR